MLSVAKSDGGRKGGVGGDGEEEVEAGRTAMHACSPRRPSERLGRRVGPGPGRSRRGRLVGAMASPWWGGDHSGMDLDCCGLWLRGDKIRERVIQGCRKRRALGA